MSTHPTFTALSDAPGLDVVDPIETRHFSLSTGSAVEPRPADPDDFAFPVSAACRIRTDRLELPNMVPMEVRAPDGDHRGSIDLPTTREFPADEYLLELHSPIKVYLRVESALSVDATEDAVVIEFDREVPVEVGARSYHSSPAATVTVPDDPEALMEAVSVFPSALKTTSPERAWPTLRGHPPRIERGDELRIPEGLDPPDTGTTIAVPPEYGYVYAVAPLAYYLGAEVVPAESPRLTADSGVDRHLGGDVSAVADAVADLLKRTLVLDCVTRTEGLYPDDLHEREVLESRVDLDFAALYEAPPGERLAAYLSVPDEAIAAAEPPWHRVTHVQPTPDAAELLPYVVNDLSAVGVVETGDEPWTPTESQRQTDEAIDAFLRRPEASDDDFLRSASVRGPTRRGPDEESDDDRASDGDSDDREPDEESDDRAPESSVRGVPDADGYMSLPDTDALEQAWVGDRTPVQGTKLIREAFEHDTPASEDGTVEITVVCNDADMREELDSAAEIYGSRDDLRVNVTCEFGVETDRLRDLLAEQNDMFHFIGHIDGRGFECPDGVLDAATLDATGAKTVLLNGCRSHDQGVELVKSGASAAVVSLADLWNAGAVEVGETLARLLHFGFGVGSAIELVREYTSLGNQYVVVGDPSTSFIHCEDNQPLVYHVDTPTELSEPSDEVSVEAAGYVRTPFGIGSIILSYLPDIEKFHICSGWCGTTNVDLQTFQETLSGTWPPLVVDGELIWSKDWFKRIN